MKIIFLASCTLLALVAACDCPKADPPPPVFSLAFSADTANASGRGFRRAEVRSAYLVRYATADFRQLLDTLRQRRPRFIDEQTLDIGYYPGQPLRFYLNDRISNSVFARSFVLVLPAAARRYSITNLVIAQEVGSGRCPDTRTTRNEATVNGQVLSALGALPELSK